MQAMGPFERALYFGDVSQMVKETDPNREEQLPETQNDVLAAKRTWELNHNEINAKAYVAAMRRNGLHEEADAFAFEHLKVKPKFTISEGF